MPSRKRALPCSATQSAKPEAASPQPETWLERNPDALDDVLDFALDNVERERAAGERPGVLVADSFGQPWRLGQTEVAIGCAGIVTVDDWRGRSDAHGRRLEATSIAVADQLAGAADLSREKDSGRPAVVIRGAGHLWTTDDGPGAAATLQRSAGEDLFR